MNLLVPETAKKQTDRIMDAIKCLDELPFRHQLYQNYLKPGPKIAFGRTVMPFSLALRPDH